MRRLRRWGQWGDINPVPWTSLYVCSEYELYLGHKVTTWKSCQVQVSYDWVDGAPDTIPPSWIWKLTNLRNEQESYYFWKFVSERQFSLFLLEHDAFPVVTLRKSFTYFRLPAYVSNSIDSLESHHQTTVKVMDLRDLEKPGGFIK